MQALVQSGFGPATDVLSMAQVERPSAGRREALVRVKASGLAKGIWLITHGLPYIARPAYGMRTPKQRIAGLQFAGTVAALGEDTEGLAVGDAVFGLHAGALAEYVAAPVEVLAAKPGAVSFEQAAAAPISGLTALQAVRDGGRTKPGDRMLVLGASGGVGSCTVKIAKAFGAEVTGVASTRNLTMLRELGSDHVVDYTIDDPTASRPDYDIIVDIAGNRPVRRLLGALAPRGTLVIVGGTGGRWTMGFERTLGGMLLAPFVTQRILGMISSVSQHDLAALAELMASGTLRPTVQSTVPISGAAAAIEAVGAGHASGTTVVTL